MFATPPRAANHKHVARLHRYVEMYCDRGLDMFQNVHTLRDLNLLEGCKTGKFRTLLPNTRDDIDVECIAFCTDQEQCQLTGGEFVLTPDAGLGRTGVRLSDDFHRWNNDLAMALAKQVCRQSKKQVR